MSTEEKCPACGHPAHKDYCFEKKVTTADGIQVSLMTTCKCPPSDEPLHCGKCNVQMSIEFPLEPPNHGLCHLCSTEVLGEALEILAIFAMHGRALRSADPANLAPLKEISKVGVSALCGGAFSLAIELDDKYNRREDA